VEKRNFGTMPTAKKHHVARTKTGKKLRELAERMVASTDPKEVKRLKTEITRLFYANA
jgi:ribosomal protein L35